MDKILTNYLKLLHFLLFLMVVGLPLFVPPSAASGGFNTPFVQIHRYVYGSQRLSVVTVIMREQEGELAFTHPDLSLYPRYTEALLDYLNSWVPESYIKLGVIERDSAIHHALLHGDEKTIDHRSALVFITEENDLSKILAFARFARQGNQEINNLLPLEKRNPELQLPTPVATTYRHGDSTSYASGIGETKNFIHDPDAEFGYMGLLFWRAIESGVIGHTFHRELVAGSLQSVIPAYYTGETHPAALRVITQDMGFELMEALSDPAKAFQLYVRQNIEDVYQMDRHFMGRTNKRRPHLPIVPENFTAVRWEPVRLNITGSCHTALGEPLPFYRDMD